MLKEDSNVTAVGLKSKLLGIDMERRMLIPIFQEHNDKVVALESKILLQKLWRGIRLLLTYAGIYNLEI